MNYTKITPLLAYLSLLIILLCSCKSVQYVEVATLSLANPHATLRTKLLYQKIKALSQQGILIGHQDATAYGINWKASKKFPYKSDIKDVTGKYPAVHGWDVGRIELGKAANLDRVSFDLMRKQILKTYKKGGISTLSWHVNNPASGGDSWDTIPAVSTILRGGINRNKYEAWVKKLGEFIKSLKTGNGELIPIVFRPYHEMNGSWFWWGAQHCSVEEYKALFRDLVWLLGQNGVHNILYAYSPNTLHKDEEYGLYYPGDAYVDILGIDIYNHSGDGVYTEKLKNDIAVMREFSRTRNKPYALTETGNMKPDHLKWWTEILYPGIKDSGIAWVLFWRNAKKSHYFAPYPSEPSSEDFKIMSLKKDILFLKEIRRYKFKEAKYPK
ncbi:MAG: glycosyl hydrolase [Bacteroidota bacterium]